ncbi:MAG TPA: PDC sensor domain-containing protein [Candidatus Saccharimonadales bacterium]|nr:PDC sensor domain-containing protein [Candidatus Saccharimonadales bacterium]
MEKLRTHTKRHGLLYIISVIILLFIIAAATLNYHTIIASRKAFYTSTLEQQGLSGLSLYQEGSSTLVKQYFTEALGTITNLASDQGVQQAAAGSQSAAALAILNQQRMISGQFDSLTIISGSGKMVAISSNSGNVAPGTDETQSPAFLAGKGADSAVLIPVHYSQLNRNVLSVAAPIKDKNGRFIGTVSGAITLASLAQHVQLSSQYDSAFSTLLTDASGNALVWQNKAVQSISNEVASEPTLKALMRQGTVPANEEYNLAQVDSFAQGSAVDFGAAGKLYLVSFYDVNEYQKRVNEGMQDITTTFSGFIIRDGVLFLLAVVIIGITIRVYEARRA